MITDNVMFGGHKRQKCTKMFRKNSEHEKPYNMFHEKKNTQV